MSRLLRRKVKIANSRKISVRHCGKEGRVGGREEDKEYQGCIILGIVAIKKNGIQSTVELC